jgi:hypothetical protein
MKEMPFSRAISFLLFKYCCDVGARKERTEMGTLVLFANKNQSIILSARRFLFSTIENVKSTCVLVSCLLESDRQQLAGR